MKIKELISYLEEIAPGQYQESYDNSGLLVGDSEAEIKSVLISLDCTEAVVADAISKGCNVIISHHPIIFKGLKSLTGRNYVERTIIKAIQNNIALIAIHTNLDNMKEGVNKEICSRLGLENCGILDPKTEELQKLVVFAPSDAAEDIKSAAFNAGAGSIGNYSECSFTLRGTGTFLPNEAANPHIGTAGQRGAVDEVRIEMMFPRFRQSQILSAVKAAHPYEEVAYYLTQLENENQEIGAGMVGELPAPLEGPEFLKMLKARMNLKIVRHTALLPRPVRKVAVCGGSGIFLLNQAKAAGADAFVTADVKYHEFFDAEQKLLLADIGHYESEQFTMNLLRRYITEKFTTFAVYLTGANTNPINYY